MARGGIRGALVAMVAVGGCTEPPCEARVGDLCPLVGTGELGFNRDGLAPEDSDLFLVSAARRGPDGRLYVMDFNNQRLRRIGDAGTMETVIGNGFHAIADVDRPLLDTPLENPFDFGFLADGSVVFVSYQDPRVLRVGADGTLEVIAGADDGVVGMRGDEGDGGPATAAPFMQLDGSAVGADDTLYVSDSLANRVGRSRGGGMASTAWGCISLCVSSARTAAKPLISTMGVRSSWSAVDKKSFGVHVFHSSDRSILSGGD